MFKTVVLGTVLTLAFVGCKKKEAAGTGTGSSGSAASNGSGSNGSAGGSAAGSGAGSDSGSGSGSAGSATGSAAGSDGSGAGSAGAATGSADGSGSGSDLADEAPTPDAVFGGLPLGAPENKVLEVLGKAEKAEPGYEEGASGEWLVEWKYPSKGVELVMGGKTNATLHSITLTAPSTLKNADGIGIGSPRADIEKRYAKLIDKSESRESTIILGSVYGGTFFDFENGKVSRIFVGAGAE